jgi:hypothetical protein
VKWARLTHARIVAEMFTDAYAPQGAYGKWDEAACARVLAACRRAGAAIVVDSNLPDLNRPVTGAFRRVGNKSETLAILCTACGRNKCF